MDSTHDPRADQAPVRLDVDQLAAIKLLASVWPAQGKRHECYLALSGGLAHKHVPAKVSVAIVEALAEATNDDEVGKRTAMVQPAKDRVRKGEPTVGWPKLRELLGADVVNQAILLLGLAVNVAELARVRKLPV